MINTLNKPKLITPTRTRKYLATILQLLDMNDAELTWLINHFGHTKDVHRQWYRQDDSTIELTKVARVLCAVDKEESVKNKKIDEVGETKLAEEAAPATEDCRDNEDAPNNPGPSKYYFSNSVWRVVLMLDYIWQQFLPRNLSTISGHFILQC